MNKNNLKIGQVVYLLEYYDKQQKLLEYTIKTIGRKHLKVWNSENIYSIQAFDMTDNYRHFSYYGSKYKLYFSKEDYEDELKKKEIEKYILNYFSSYATLLSLEQLVKIKEIINSNNEE